MSLCLCLIAVRVVALSEEVSLHLGIHERSVVALRLGYAEVLAQIVHMPILPLQLPLPHHPKPSLARALLQAKADLWNIIITFTIPLRKIIEDVQLFVLLLLHPFLVSLEDLVQLGEEMLIVLDLGGFLNYGVSRCAILGRWPLRGKWSVFLFSSSTLPHGRRELHAGLLGLSSTERRLDEA